jgi:hypothetical protein
VTKDIYKYAAESHKRHCFCKICKNSVNMPFVQLFKYLAVKLKFACRFYTMLFETRSVRTCSGLELLML